MSRPQYPILRSPIRLFKRAELDASNSSGSYASASSPKSPRNSSHETVFALLSQSDLSGRKVVTAKSIAQFMNAMRIITTAETISDLIRATAVASSPEIVGASQQRSDLANGTDLSLSEQQVYALFDLLPNTISIVLGRCELLADMAEQPLVAARLSDEIRARERVYDLLEEDNRSLASQLDAVQRRCEALEAATGTSVAIDSRSERHGSPTLRSAQVEQRERLSALTDLASKAAESLDALIGRHQTSTEATQTRELEAAAAEDALRVSDLQLREHTASMFDIEQRYLAAKAAFDAAQDIQRGLSRERQRRQENLTKATTVLQEAAALEQSLQRSIEAADSDLHNNLKVEIRDTQKIVKDLEAAAFVPSRKDRELTAAKSEREDLMAQMEELGARIRNVNADMLQLQDERKSLELVAERHMAWVAAPATDKAGKSYEDNLLLSELKRAIDRQFLDVEERRFSERRAQRLADFYRDRQAL